MGEVYLQLWIFPVLVHDARLILPRIYVHLACIDEFLYVQKCPDCSMVYFAGWPSTGRLAGWLI